jgi:hypothetical protein
MFGSQWDKAGGFERPPKWQQPSAIYYIGPLPSCLVVAFATFYLDGYLNFTPLAH